MLRDENLCFLVFTRYKVSVHPKKFIITSPLVSRYSGAGPGDTNGSILYDYAKHMILFVKVKIVLNSSCNLELYIAHNFNFFTNFNCVKTYFVVKLIYLIVLKL